MRIGILGGTFDPIHRAHIAIADAAISTLNLDKVLLIPAADPSFKQGTVKATIKDRLSMCELAAEGHPNVEVSDIEAKRLGVTYSIDTVRELRTQLPSKTELIFLVGTDAAELLPKWHESETLSAMIDFAIFSRDGSNFSADELSAMLAQNGFRTQMLEMNPIDISSTQVRKLISEGEDVSAFVSPSVLAYIEAHGLYESE